MSSRNPQGKPAALLLIAVVLILLVSIASHVFLVQLHQRQSIEFVNRFVPVEDHNELVRAQNKLTVLFTNQQSLLDHQQMELNALARLCDRLDGTCVRTSSLADLHVKMSEYEERLRKQTASGAELQDRIENLLQLTNRLESPLTQSTSLTQISNKVDALQRAFIKLSLGLQSLEAAAKPRE